MSTAFAHGHDRHGLASLLDLDVSQLAQLVPQLARQPQKSFAIEQVLRIFTVAELLRAYETELGAPSRRQLVRARQITRQLAGLRWSNVSTAWAQAGTSACTASAPARRRTPCAGGAVGADPRLPIGDQVDKPRRQRGGQHARHDLAWRLFRSLSEGG